MNWIEIVKCKNSLQEWTSDHFKGHTGSQLEHRRRQTDLSVGWRYTTYSEWGTVKELVLIGLWVQSLRGFLHLKLMLMWLDFVPLFDASSSINYTVVQFSRPVAWLTRAPEAFI